MPDLAGPALPLEALRLPFRQRLKSMYAGELQPGDDGPVELDKITRVSESQGMWMYETCRQLKPRRTLEVGLGFGFSTIFILAAIDENGIGHHTAIDPFQRKWWHGVGALQAQHLGMRSSFLILEELSVIALARLVSQKEEFGLIYIDGDHRFDGALADFTLAAQICPVGGQVILDDMWMPSIQMVVSWIRSNRTDFREVPTPIQNIAQFERVGRDSRDWDHFVRFWGSDDIEVQPSLSSRVVRRLKRVLAT